MQKEQSFSNLKQNKAGKLPDQLKKNQLKFRSWKLSPAYGSILFTVLYLIAAMLYPGGHYLDNTTNGFSWQHNFWCNLLTVSAINGHLNTARPVALVAMAVLAITLMIFWIIFPKLAGMKGIWKYLIQWSGCVAMAISLFLSSAHHDEIITIAGLFAAVALTGTMVGLWRLRWLTLFALGLLAALLVGLNNLLYYGKNLLYYLPVVQKITFILFLFWIGAINVRLVRRNNTIT